MNEVITTGVDLAKNVFQIHGVDAEAAVVVRSRVWRSVRDVMQNRSNRGSGKPAIATAPRARGSDWDPTPRIALGPAAMYAAPKGRTHGSTRPARINVTKLLPTGSRPHMRPFRPMSAFCRFRPLYL